LFGHRLESLYILAVCFWRRANPRYSKPSYNSARNRSWLHCDLLCVKM